MNLILIWLKDLLVKHHSLLLMVLAICGVYFTGYYMGHRNAPTKVVVQEKIVEKIVTQSQTDTKSSDNTNEKKRENEHTHIVTTTTKNPDGTIVTKTTTDVNQSQSDTKVEIRYVDRVQTVTQTVEREVTVTKTIETAKPNWMVKAMAGASFNQTK